MLRIFNIIAKFLYLQDSIRQKEIDHVNAGLKMHQSAGVKIHHLRPREGPCGGLLSGGLILWVWRGRRVPVQRSGGVSWID